MHIFPSNFDVEYIPQLNNFFFKVDGLCYLLHEIYGLESKEESEHEEVSYLMYLT